MKQVLTRIAPALVIAGLSVAALPVGVMAGPQDERSSKALCEGAGGTWNGSNDTCNRAGTQSFPEALGAITDLLLFIVGAIAVIVIIVGAIRYVTSSGDQTAVTSAKNTILFAVIGLVIALMAYAIVKFVVGAL